MSLYINGLKIEKYKEEIGALDEEDVFYNVPDYLLIEKKNADQIVMDMTDDETEALKRILNIDVDKYLNKKTRIIIQTIGPKDKGGR